MTVTKKSSLEPAVVPDSHAVERKFYKALGLPYCEKCFHHLMTDLAGKPICQVNTESDCPLTKKD